MRYQDELIREARESGKAHMRSGMDWPSAYDVAVEAVAAKVLRDLVNFMHQRKHGALNHADIKQFAREKGIDL